jgi:hypothetical protein
MAEIPVNNWKLLYEGGRQALQARKLQDAEQSFSAALQLAEDYAAGDPRLAATLNALARIYSLQRRYLAAAALLNRLLEVTERTLGPTHVQVAGVLTNLAEMYTHLGAAREELELRERVLRIRGEAPDADIASLQRVWDRVAELRAILIAQEGANQRDDDIDGESLPIVQTAEYSSPTATAEEPESEPADDQVVSHEPVVAHVATTAAAAKVSVPKHEEAYSYDGSPKTVVMAGVQMISVAPEQPTTTTADYGFSDMGRDELLDDVAPRKGRSSLFSIAAGVVLVAGLIAARDYVTSSEERGVSTGSVSLAASTPQAAGVKPVTQSAANASVAEPEPDSGTVERVISGRRVEEEVRRTPEPASTPDNFGPYRPASAQRRVPTTDDLERALRSVDGAVKSIATRTKAAADSALALKVQAPTFKKIRIADNPPTER